MIIIRENIENLNLGSIGLIVSEQSLLWFVSKNPISAYRYAHFILDAPWPLGEKAIATDADAASRYALNVMKSRWLAGEPAIIKYGDTHVKSECGYLWRVEVYNIIILQRGE